MNQRGILALLLAWLLFWALMVATAVQDFLRHDEGPLWQPILWESSSMAVATLLLALQRLGSRRHDGLLATPARWFGRQALWLPLWWLLFTPLAFGIRHAVYGALGMRYEHEPWGETFVYENIKISIFVVIFTLITFGVLSFRAAERANAQLRTAQLHQLTQQMQPHFLFNALNTISSLMHSDVERADATLVQLADVLRATLDVSGQQQAPLSTELRLLRGYARLMEERFADRVLLEWDVDAGCGECLVPVMSMQPLLENVFKHTVERRRGVTRIAISAKRDGDGLLLAVSDDAGRLSPRPASPGGRAEGRAADVRAVGGGAAGAVGGATGTVTDAVGGAAGAVTGVMGGATGAVAGAVGGATGAVAGAVGGAAGAVTGVMGGAAGAVTGVMGGAARAVAGAVGGAAGAVAGGGVSGGAVGGAEGDGGAGGGIGVRNLRERLQALYGARASLVLVQLEPAGVRAEMRLPCVS